MNSADVVGKTYTVRYALKANSKTYTFTINVTFVGADYYSPTVVRTINVAFNDYAGIAYRDGEHPTFTVSDVTTTLGISNITDATLYCVNMTDGNFLTYRNDGWHNADGDTKGWGDCANGYCLKLDNPTSGTFNYSGAHDANFAVGDTYELKYAFVYNDQAVVIDVVITFIAEPTHNFQVVNTQNINLDVYEKSSGAAMPNNTTTFDLSQTLTDLGVSDASTLSAWIVNVTDGEYLENTTDGWRDPNGDRAGWGTTGGVCVKLDNISSGTINWIGFYDTTHNAGETYTAKWAIANASEEVEMINVVLNIIAAPTPPTIVETINLSFFAPAETASTGTSAGVVNFSTDAVKTSLGINDLSTCELFIVNVTDDEFVNNSTDGWRDANGDMAYWGATGGVCVKQPNVSSGTISDIFFFDNTHPDGDVYHAKWGIVNPSTNEAVVLDLAITFYTPVTNLSQLTSTNTSVDKTVTINMNDGFSNQTFTIDNLATVASTLGCAVSDIKLFVKKNTNNDITTDAPHAGNQGFWIDLQSLQGTYGEESAKVYIENSTANDFTSWNVGTAWGVFNEVQTWTGTLYFVNEVGKTYTPFNITINVTIDNLELWEGDENGSDLTAANGRRANVLLDRTFYAGWNTLVLPFEMSIEDLSQKTSSISEIGTFTGDELNGENITIHFTKLDEIQGTLPAATPVLVYFASDAEASLQLSNVIINASNPVTNGTNFAFTGTYVQGELIQIGDYYLGSGNTFKKSSKVRTTKGFRAFFHPLSSSVKASAVSFEFDSEATAINAIDGEEVNTLIGEWYTLAGQRINAPTVKGLYIKNGKKVMIK